MLRLVLSSQAPGGASHSPGGNKMKDYVAPRLTVVGTLEELTARSEVGPTSDMPLAHLDVTHSLFS